LKLAPLRGQLFFDYSARAGLSIGELFAGVSDFFFAGLRATGFLVVFALAICLFGFVIFSKTFYRFDTKIIAGQG